MFYGDRKAGEVAAFERGQLLIIDRSIRAHLPNNSAVCTHDDSCRMLSWQEEVFRSRADLLQQPPPRPMTTNPVYGCT